LGHDITTRIPYDDETEMDAEPDAGWIAPCGDRRSDSRSCFSAALQDVAVLQDVAMLQDVDVL
jgi:hypothetical protein